MPESFKDAKLDNFKKNVYKEQKSKDMIVEAAKAIKYWLQNFNNMKKRGIGLYIYSGTKGSGKTRLAVSLANEIIYKYKAEVKFATSLQILNAIKSTWAVKGDSENQLLNDFSTIDILILDDFGIEQAKEWINDRFYEIINGRYIRKKITIFTSNMRLDDLDYDDRITNRIKERVFQIPFPEESVRDTLSNQLREELINGMTGNQ